MFADRVQRRQKDINYILHTRSCYHEQISDTKKNCKKDILNLSVCTIPIHWSYGVVRLMRISAAERILRKKIVTVTLTKRPIYGRSRSA